MKSGGNGLPSVISQKIELFITTAVESLTFKEKSFMPIQNCHKINVKFEGNIHDKFCQPQHGEQLGKV
jgi:hypothetical protein